METRTCSPVTRANQAKQRHWALLGGEAHPGRPLCRPAFQHRAGPLGWAARIPASIHSTAFWPLTCQATEGTGDAVPEKKMKSKVEPLWSILWMLNVPRLPLGMTFHGQQGRRPGLRAEQMAGAQARPCPRSLRDL